MSKLRWVPWPSVVMFAVLGIALGLAIAAHDYRRTVASSPGWAV
ncbi:MAG TPA: hypothetical protein VE985_01895 [Gaiellaceae bacterium]|nr:hypothetical protein [Gaiellaceae bacterium]